MAPDLDRSTRPIAERIPDDVDFTFPIVTSFNPSASSSATPAGIGAGFAALVLSFGDSGVSASVSASVAPPASAALVLVFAPEMAASGAPGRFCTVGAAGGAALVQAPSATNRQQRPVFMPSMRHTTPSGGGLAWRSVTLMATRTDDTLSRVTDPEHDGHTAEHKRRPRPHHAFHGSAAAERNIVRRTRGTRFAIPRCLGGPFPERQIARGVQRVVRGDAGPHSVPSPARRVCGGSCRTSSGADPARRRVGVPLTTRLAHFRL